MSTTTYAGIVNASKAVSVANGRFVDGLGRQIILRGINFAGDSKVPMYPKYTPSHAPEDAEFYDGDHVSFVGSPFALDEVDEHLDRLKAWGFNTLRYLFTWEALEHEGPGIYDDQFIDYTIAMLYKIRERGFRVIMDPHQDVWSRYCGGSGAPMWTLHAAGLDPTAFRVTEAAILENHFEDPCRDRPKMLWSSNGTRLAAATMFTLFFGGRDFAPRCVLNGQNIQDYLQTHFINAVAHLARRIYRYHPQLVKDNSTIIGWESINEPGEGFIGNQNITVIPKHQQLKIYHTPTAAQTIALGSGFAQDNIAHYSFTSMGPKQTGVQSVDPQGVSVWLTPEQLEEIDARYGWERAREWSRGECIWKQHGVWTVRHPGTARAAPYILRSNYFARDGSGVVCETHRFVNKHFTDHWLAYSRKLRTIIGPTTLLFLQPPVLVEPPELKARGLVDPYMVYTPHYYDGLTLMQKHWNTRFNVDALGVLRNRYRSPPVMAVRLGERNIRSSFASQLVEMKREGQVALGPDVPMFISEIGIPYDLDEGRAYRNGDFSSQVRALDANHYALEQAELSYSLWCYSGHNTNEHGDGWNGEDLSLWSKDRVVGGHIYQNVTCCPDTIVPKLITRASRSSSGVSAKSQPAGDPGSRRNSAASQLFRRMSNGGLKTGSNYSSTKDFQPFVYATGDSSSTLASEPGTPPRHHKHKHRSHHEQQEHHHHHHRHRHRKDKNKKSKNKVFVPADANPHDDPSSSLLSPQAREVPAPLTPSQQQAQVQAELDAQAEQKALGNGQDSISFNATVAVSTKAERYGRRSIRHLRRRRPEEAAQGAGNAVVAQALVGMTGPSYRSVSPRAVPDPAASSLAVERGARSLSRPRTHDAYTSPRRDGSPSVLSQRSYASASSASGSSSSSSDSDDEGNESDSLSSEREESVGRYGAGRGELAPVAESPVSGTRPSSMRSLGSLGHEAPPEPLYAPPPPPPPHVPPPEPQYQAPPPPVPEGASASPMFKTDFFGGNSSGSSSSARPSTAKSVPSLVTSSTSSGSSGSSSSVASAPYKSAETGPMADDDDPGAPFKSHSAEQSMTVIPFPPATGGSTSGALSAATTVTTVGPAGRASIVRTQSRELQRQRLLGEFHNPSEFLEGARGPEAFIRPYPVSIAGRLASYTFDLKNGGFRLRLEGSAQTMPEGAIRGIHQDFMDALRRRESSVGGDDDEEGETDDAVMRALRLRVKAEKQAMRHARKEERRAEALRDKERQMLERRRQFREQQLQLRASSVALQKSASSGTGESESDAEDTRDPARHAEFLLDSDSDPEVDEDFGDDTEEDDTDDDQTAAPVAAQTEEDVIKFFAGQGGGGHSPSSSSDLQFGASPYNNLHLVPTVIFLPTFHFPYQATAISASSGLWKVDRATQLLYWWHLGGPQEIEVKGIGVDKNTMVINSAAAAVAAARLGAAAPAAVVESAASTSRRGSYAMAFD